MKAGSLIQTVCEDLTKTFRLCKLEELLTLKLDRKEPILLSNGWTAENRSSEINIEQFSFLSDDSEELCNELDKATKGVFRTEKNPKGTEKSENPDWEDKGSLQKRAPRLSEKIENSKTKEVGGYQLRNQGEVRATRVPLRSETRCFTDAGRTRHSLSQRQTIGSSLKESANCASFGAWIRNSIGGDNGMDWGKIEKQFYGKQFREVGDRLLEELREFLGAEGLQSKYSENVSFKDDTAPLDSLLVAHILKLVLTISGQPSLRVLVANYPPPSTINGVPQFHGVFAEFVPKKTKSRAGCWEGYERDITCINSNETAKLKSIYKEDIGSNSGFREFASERNLKEFDQKITEEDTSEKMLTRPENVFQLETSSFIPIREELVGELIYRQLKWANIFEKVKNEQIEISNPKLKMGYYPKSDKKILEDYWREVKKEILRRVEGLGESFEREM